MKLLTNSVYQRIIRPYFYKAYQTSPGKIKGGRDKGAERICVLITSYSPSRINSSILSPLIDYPLTQTA